MTPEEADVMRDTMILTAATFVLASANPWVNVNMVAFGGGFIIGELVARYMGLGVEE